MSRPENRLFKMSLVAKPITNDVNPNPAMTSLNSSEGTITVSEVNTPKTKMTMKVSRMYSTRSRRSILVLLLAVHITCRATRPRR